MKSCHSELTMSVSKTTESSSYEEMPHHNLKNRWNFWAHLPQEPDWTSVKSYKKVYTFNTVEETIAITETLPEDLVKNCMLFIMRDGIIPMWEDPRNRNGGYFSYKVSNKNVYNVWRDITYTLVGESISNNTSFINSVMGITISPKKNFCILKIWMTNCEHQNPQIVTDEIKNLSSHGCLFKEHKPQF